MQEALAEKIQAALVIVRRAMAQIDALPRLSHNSFAGVTLRAVAERLYQERRIREEHFATGLFGEPAWDLMLALFIAREDGRDMTPSEAYEAARVKPRSGSRLVRRMELEGLVTRSRAGGGREGKVTLTADALERLTDYLLACGTAE